MTRPLRSTSITPASSLQRNRLSAAARFRRRGNDLRAFHSLWVGKAGGALQRNRLSAAARFRRGGNDLRAFHSLWVGKACGELLRSSPPLAGASVLSASRFEPLVPCMGLSESISSPPLSFFRPIPLFDRGRADVSEARVGTKG